MRRSLSQAITLLSTVSLVACSTAGPGSEGLGIQVGDDIAVGVSTVLSPDAVLAGEWSIVECTVISSEGEGLSGVLTSFTVEPADSVTIDGERVTAGAAGEYTVRCEAPELPLQDEMGAVLTVTIGDASTITAVLDEPVVEAHQTTEVDCVVADAAGNRLTADTVVSAPDEEVQVSDYTVSADKAGKYDVLCDLTGDAAGSLTQVPGELKVVAGPPATVELGVTPDLPSYSVGQVVDLFWVIRDAYGNQVLGVAATLEVPDADLDVIDEEDHKYRLPAEGLYPFEVTLESPYELVTDFRTLVVDETGPEIIVTWPSRGETVEGDGDFLYIEGTVIDAFGQVGLFEIDDIPVAIEDDGSFETFVLPEWGVNLIEARAVDEFGNTTRVSPSYQYSPEYLNYDGTTVEDVIQEDGLEVLLGQEFLDDGDHDLAHVDDLATILEIILSELDFAALTDEFGGFPVISLPLNVFDIDLGIAKVAFGGYVDATVTIIDPTDIGPTMVTIDSRLGGIDTGIEFGDAENQGMVVSLLIEAEINFGLLVEAFGLTVLEPEITAGVALGSQMSIDNMLLATKVDIHKIPGEELQVDLVQLDNELVGFELDPLDDVAIAFELDGLPFGLGPFGFEFNLSELFDLTAFTDLILDPLTTDFVPLVIDFIKPLIEEFADGILKELLMAFELQTSLPLPELLGPKPEPIELELATALSRVNFTDDGGQIGLSMGLHADKNVEPEPLGSIQRAGCFQHEEDLFYYDWERSAGAAIQTDVINAGLFAAWRSGFLDGPVDLGGLLGSLGGEGGGLGGFPIPLDDMQVNMTWLMAPVLNDCGGKGILQMEFGDLLVDLEADLLGSAFTATLYVDAGISVFFGASEEGLTLTVGNFAFFEVEVVSFEEDGDGLIDVRDLLENQLGTLLGEFIVGQGFGPLDIPPVVLGDIVPGLPPEAVLKLGNLGITKDKGYVVIGADLQ